MQKSSHHRMALSVDPARKRYFWVRHGEAQHNVVINAAKEAGNHVMLAEGRGILDPSLTETGRSQAGCLRESIGRLGVALDVVVTSPMVRALETTDIAFRGTQVLILATSLHTETGIKVEGDDVAGQNCQKGSSADAQMAKFPNIDFKHVEQEGNWISDENEEAYFHPLTAEERLEPFRDWLQSLPFENILIIGHSGFFKRFLTQDVKMGNCEIIERSL